MARRCRAFTLVEMILATGLLVLLMGMLYEFYDTSLTMRDQGLEHTRRLQLVRVVLDRIAEEIRYCSDSTPGYGPGLVGNRYQLTVLTPTLPTKELMRRRSLTEKALAAQFDLREIRYSIAWDEENLDEEGNWRALGLVRRETQTFNQAIVVEGDEGDDATAAIKRELYAPEIKFIEFAYFDGRTWWDTWGGGLVQNLPLPQMVKITVGFKKVLPPEATGIDVVDEDEDLSEDELRRQYKEEDRHSVIVRLAQADRFFRSRITREVTALGEEEAEGDGSGGTGEE
jgi:hypothetical protein